MNSRDTSTLKPKGAAALVAIAMALTGVVTGLQWLTVTALLLWVAAMLYFGRGNRNKPE